MPMIRHDHMPFRNCRGWSLPINGIFRPHAHTAEIEVLRPEIRVGDEHAVGGIVEEVDKTPHRRYRINDALDSVVDRTRADGEQRVAPVRRQGVCPRPELQSPECRQVNQFDLIPWTQLIELIS